MKDPQVAQRNSRVRFALGVTAAASVAAALSGCGVNAIPTKDEKVKAAWGDVQNAYQRRSDLIPNLVNTVQAAAANERGILVDVQNARSKATSINVSAADVSDPSKIAQYQQAQGELSQALGRLMVVQERYPDLKSNTNFMTLQSQLEGTENRIAVSRRDYNDAVRDYNVTLRTFPTVLWAKTLYGSQKEAQPFAATAAAQTAPQVQFNIPPAGGAVPAAATGPAPMGGAPSSASSMPGGGTTTTTTSTSTTAPNR